MINYLQIVLNDAWFRIYIFDLSLKSVLIFLLAFAACNLLRHRPASARHLVWALAFCAVLVLPFSGTILPQQISQPIAIPASTQPQTASPLWSETAAGAQSSTLESSPPPVPRKVEAASSEPFQLHWQKGLILLWLFGAAVLLIRFVLSIAVIWLISMKARPVASPDWLARLETCRQLFSIRRTVRIKSSTMIPFPITFGLLRPVVIIPSDAGQWSAEQRELVLLHETAHMMRLDALTAFLAQLACALFWHNPLAWLARRRMQLECENACDDAVLQQNIPPHRYASILLRFAEIAGRKPLWTRGALHMAQQSEIKHRLKYILHPGRRQQPFKTTAYFHFIIITLLLSSSLGLSGFRAQQVGELSETHRAQNAYEMMPISNFTSLPAFTDQLELLHSSNSAQRAAAAKMLAQTKNARAIQPLLACLTDTAAEVREAALLALARYGLRSTFADIVKLACDNEPAVRTAALLALQQIGCDPAFVTITASLRDPSAKVRMVAAHLLSDLKYKPFEKRLHTVLKEYSRTASAIVVSALGPFENVCAIDYLRGAAADPNVDVRLTVAQTLAKINNQKTRTILLEMRNDADKIVRETVENLLLPIRS